MSELNYLDYETVKKAVGEENALDTYRQVARIAGADDNPNHDGGISLVGLDEKSVTEIKKLLEKPKSADKKDK